MFSAHGIQPSLLYALVITAFRSYAPARIDRGGGGGRHKVKPKGGLQALLYEYVRTLLAQVFECVAAIAFLVHNLRLLHPHRHGVVAVVAYVPAQLRHEPAVPASAAETPGNICRKGEVH